MEEELMSTVDLSPVPRPATAEPWKRLTGTTKIGMLLSIVVPAAIFLGFLAITGTDFMGALFTVFLPLQVLAAVATGVASFGKKGALDALLYVVTIFLSAFVLVLLLSVIWSLVEGGLKAISPHFFYQNSNYVQVNTSLEYGGVGHAIVGTFLIVGVTTIITVPLAIATGVYLTETRGKSRGLIRTLLQAMSGLPSVVAGLFVYSMLIVSGVTKYAGWAGSVALIPLMLPTVARVTEEALRLVPVELRNGALALGAPAWRAFLQVTLPAARTGILTAVLLGVARVIGETAPLLLTTMVGSGTNWNVFSGPIATLPTFLYNYVSQGFDTSIQRAWGAGLVIMILVAVLFTAARIVARPVGQFRKKGK
jgi:phosphate transport system permease protein